MHGEQPFGFGIERLEHVIWERPRRGNAMLMHDLAEIPLPQPEQRRPVHLGVAAYIVVEAWMKAAAVTPVPGFRCLIRAVDKHGLGIPVRRRARQVVTPLDQQDALAGGRQPLHQRGAAGATADHDDVISDHGDLSSRGECDTWFNRGARARIGARRYR